MENGPFEGVFPIENGDIPLLCSFTRGHCFLLDMASFTTLGHPVSPASDEVGSSVAWLLGTPGLKVLT